MIKRFHWWVVSIGLLMLTDIATPPPWGLCVLHLLLLPLAWRYLHRRYITQITAIQLLAVAIAGIWHLAMARTQSPLGISFDPVRLWTFLAIMAAGYFHLYLRRRLRTRLEHQRVLQHRVRRRSDEVNRINYALRDEVARRQETQHRLDRSETTFQSIIDRMQLQIARKNVDGVFTYANDRFCDELGLSPISVIGSTDADLYQPMIAAKYNADDQRIIASGLTIDQIEEHPGTDGRPGYVQVFKAPEFDRQGKCIGVQVIFWDVTERHRNEIALRDSEARKRALFDAAGDAVLLVDDEGLVMEANPSANALLQSGGGRIVGRPLDTIFVPELGNPKEQIKSGSGAKEPTWKSLALSVRHQLKLIRSDGIAFDSELSIHKIPIGAKEGRAIIIRDITLQQQAFEAMRIAKAEAEQANQTKTQFMAGISHELRTPLGGIRGLTDLLAKFSLPAQARRYVNLIAQNTELLHDVIEDILDFSAIEAGRVAIDPIEMDLHQAVGDAFGCLAIRVADKPVRLCLSIDPMLPRNVVADPKRVRQIIVNLSNNAIKFTQQGQVILRLARPFETTQPFENAQQEPSTGASDRQTVEISVVDTGIGISPENQERIFDAFEQADRGTNKKYGGTGLGLAIARGLARRMDGDIRLESRSGVGSRFTATLCLPLAASAPSSGQEKLVETLRQEAGIAVVSVGDEAIEEAIVETLLHAGWAAHLPQKNVAGVKSRLSTLLQSEGNAKKPVNWILSADKADNAWRVRARKANDRVLWLTSAGESPPRRARKEDAVLIEPVHPDELRRWLSGQPLRQSSRGRMSAYDATKEFESPDQSTNLRADNYVGYRLLVVDDSPTNRLMIHDQLVAAGHHVETVDGGRAALAIFEQKTFDCILMDLQMPEMDGTEVAVEIIKRCQALGREPVPIIALTAHVTDEHRQMCRQAGMVGYITKPIAVKPLLQEIVRVTSSSSTPSITESSTESTEATAATSESNENDGKETDWFEQLSQLCGGDETTIDSVCEAILMEVPELSKRLMDAAKRGDARKLKTAAHTMKSCLRYVAPKADTILAAEVEKLTNDEDWVAQVKSAAQKQDHDSTQLQQILQLQSLANAWVQRIEQHQKTTST